MHNFTRGFLPMACALAGVGIVLLLEPDLGAFMVCVAIAVGMLFIVGISGKLFSSLLGMLVASFLLLIWIAPWRCASLFVYLHSWNPATTSGSPIQHSYAFTE